MPEFGQFQWSASTKPDPDIIRVITAGADKETCYDVEETKESQMEQIAKKFQDAGTLLNAGKDLAFVLQTLEISEATYNRWRNQYGVMKASEANDFRTDIILN